MRQAAPQRPSPLASRLTEQEKALHDAMVQGLGNSAIWKN
jgi:DNA polymerase-3 subunit epsilon